MRADVRTNERLERFSVAVEQVRELVVVTCPLGRANSELPSEHRLDLFLYVRLDRDGEGDEDFFEIPTLFSFFLLVELSFNEKLLRHLSGPSSTQHLSQPVVIFLLDRLMPIQRESDSRRVSVELARSVIGWKQTGIGDYSSPGVEEGVVFSFEDQSSKG